MRMVEEHGSEYIYNYTMQKQTPRENMEQVFDKNCRRSFVNGIKNAYKWLSIWEQDPVNQVLLKYSGKTGRGNILSWAVTYFLIEEVKKGNINLSYRLDLTRQSKIPYLVLFDKSRNVELTVNQVPKISKPARAAINRYERIKNNFTTTLFDTYAEEKEQPFYYQLTHGYQSKEPGFINLGIPNDSTSWLDFIELSKEVYVLTNEKKTTSKPVVAGTISLEEMQNNINEVMNNE